jgi:hypothetical protein
MWVRVLFRRMKTSPETGSFFQVIPDNLGQSIESIAYVDGAATQKLPQIGDQPEHLSENFQV